MKYTGEALEHIQEHCRQMAKANIGKHMSEEAKKKISDSHKGIPCSEKAKLRSKEAFSVPVLCVELDKKFSSMKDAADYFGLNKCSISAVIKGRNKTAAGYHWKIA